ncbi:MAG: hypothetical protein DMG09_28355 [Acidobacteria bacterium]|nr:MAG: hypothetical protein DMG09_28355 [Acidobacteriota bacterium]
MEDTEFYSKLREKVAGYTSPYSDYVLLIPDLVALVARLMRDTRVHSKHKIYLGAALAYIVSPIDLMPERIFGKLAFLDDLAVLVAVLNMLLNETDNQIVLENWSGKADLLETVRNFLRQSDQVIGKARLEKILDYLGVRKPASPAGV